MTFHNLQSVGDLMARATNDVREVNICSAPEQPGHGLSISYLPLLPPYPSLIIVPIAHRFIHYGWHIWHPQPDYS